MKSGRYYSRERSLMRKTEMEHINYLEITARYAETDMMGIIHHAVYPVWFEAARTELIKDAGISYSEIEKRGIMLPLAHLECDYILPVHYEDRVTVESFITKLTPARIVFGYRVMLNGKLCVRGSTVHGFVSSETFRPTSLKKSFPELYTKLDEMTIIMHNA